MVKALRKVRGGSASAPPASHPSSAVQEGSAVPQRSSAPHEVREIIASRAFEIFVEKGGTHGHDLDDWLEAEREILRRH